MEALTLKELKKIEKWYTDHEEDMVTSDHKLYDKILAIIEDLEYSSDEEATIKAEIYDVDPDDTSDEDTRNDSAALYYEEEFDCDD